MRLMQLKLEDGTRAVAANNGDGYRLVNGFATTRDLALAAMGQGGLAAMVEKAGLGAAVDAAAALAEGRVLAPIDHEDNAHCYVTGTGLTHLGSAATRDAMHKKLGEEEVLTDSMKMFRMGLENGKPAPGETGVQPEWFYKGDGSFVAGPGAPLVSPSFALDGGEEPEIAGLYVIGPDGQPFRVGFALSNEFSDHVTERINYLYLAHSKLRPCGLGPELLVGDLPRDIRGLSRIRRDGQVIWEKPFLSGESNMSHTIANLEHHHFKYAPFRRPGDVHVHMFGTATLSFADGMKPEPGDVFEISAPEFGLPLCNPLIVDKMDAPEVRAL
ncbi:MAG: GguC family protein [Aestuariivirgaceae bacterium]|nr:GguC family protein [Aestuariivirgaceae bacterium]